MVRLHEEVWAAVEGLDEPLKHGMVEIHRGIRALEKSLKTLQQLERP